jgi:hypothetical protein
VKRKPRPNGKFITLRDAEREYGLSYHLLYGWVIEGRIARLGEVVGRTIFIKRADLESFIESNMTPVRS